LYIVSCLGCNYCSVVKVEMWQVELSSILFFRFCGVLMSVV